MHNSHKKLESLQAKGRKSRYHKWEAYNDGKVEKVYADVGAYTAEEVYNLGIQVGDMVTYTTDFEEFTLEK